MAELIRSRYRLPTLRLSFRPSRSANLVRFECNRGDDTLARIDVPASEIGIETRLSVRAYHSARFRLPEDTLRTIRKTLREIRTDDEPIWLLVDQNGYLAVVPWEHLLQPVLEAPLLRIPNFLADPTFLSGPLRLAVCLSSSTAKTPFDVPSYAATLVRAVQAGVTQGTDLHVFADADVFGPISATLPASTDRHRLQVHDPKGAERFGIGDVDRSLSDAADQLKSPWLLWMKSELTDGVDGVHFVCPGYFQRDRGALALARSPLRNVDREWAHFVGPEELGAFLRLTCAWSVMFSPPYENVWSIGTRVVAGNLAWQQPKAILVHDIQPTSSAEVDLSSAYRFLFSDDYAPPPALPSVMMYVHPKRVARYEDEDVFDGAGERGNANDLLVSAMSSSGVNRRSQGTRSAREPDWQTAARLQMKQLMLRGKDGDSATQNGVADAIATLSSIIGRGGS
jgi:hypothetical protein